MSDDLTPFPITPPPGVVKTESQRVIEGRWSDTEKVRFVDGKAQTIGGWTVKTSVAMAGPPRTLHAWRDNNSNTIIAGGTYKKLYVIDSGFVLYDITPLRLSGTLANPFTTVNGQTSVTVAHTAHGLIVGDTVVITDAYKIAGGQTVINGTYTVTTVIDANSYTITLPIAAGASGLEFTKILLHFDGADASTTVTDSNFAGSAHTWTAHGSAQIDTAISKWDGSAGLFNSATSDYIDTPDHADFALGSSDWTVDFWFTCEETTGTFSYVGGQIDSLNTAALGSIIFGRTSADKMSCTVYIGGVAITVQGTTSFNNTTNTGLHHFMAVRTGNVMKLFIDGVQEGGNVAVVGSIQDSGNKFTIGRPGELASFYWKGTVDEFSLKVGIAWQTANFTIPAGPYRNPAGGPLVAYSYEISIGGIRGAYGLGWGIGPYGGSTYGSARSSSGVFIEARVWSLDHYGQILIASYNVGKVYSWDPSAGSAYTTRAAVITDAPTDVRHLFVTAERFIVALCSSMTIKWCVQGDYTTWTPTAINTAGVRGVTEGTKLIGGRYLGNYVSLIWTDSALYLHQYTGSSLIFDTRLAGKNCGLISPSAVVVVGSVAYWMGQNSFFMFSGAVQRMPNVNDIRAYVFDNMDTTAGYQFTAMYNAKYNEVWFFYVRPTGAAGTPSAPSGMEESETPAAPGQTEPGSYVIVSLDDYSWAVGTLTRVSGTHFTHGDTRPYWADDTGYVYLHEDGYDNNGVAMSKSITLAPVGIDKGRSNMVIAGLEPDFFEQAGNVTLTLNTWDRIRASTDLPMDTDAITVSPTDTLCDPRISGRYAGLTVLSNTLGGYFRFGAPTAYVKPKGTRP